jgi:CrcB protein
MEWIAVFLGGGLGSMVRFGIARLMHSKDWDFPLATLLANIISCIILGFLMSSLTKTSATVRIFLMVGFCGGFSTFSTFTAETYQLIGAGNYLYAVLNICGSMIACLLGLLIGIRLSIVLI